ncbi:MAG: hypothetical protein WBA93_19075 [Microcoleaceae cyanobacterium]
MENQQLEICNLLEGSREEIEREKLSVYLMDECHLLWGDICGYSNPKSFVLNQNTDKKSETPLPVSCL